MRLIPDACDIIIFGALGDLAQRKLLPALFQMERSRLIDTETRILCVARNIVVAEAKEKTQKNLKNYAAVGENEESLFDTFINRIELINVIFDETDSYKSLVTALSKSKSKDSHRARIFYYATPAALYGIISENLNKNKCLTPLSRVVMEKPIGSNLESSKAINAQVAEYFDESQIYRIDHYLGKETVQNLIALRFANTLFGSQWDNNHISHVEITVSEAVGIEGRWGYFDKAGQLRDMVQNHLLQLLCLVAMDPPTDLSADSIRNEKVKVLKALKPITSETISTHVVRGQYKAGNIKGKPVPGYLEEEGANTDSETETFVAIRAEVQNWRWAGVPFYLRTGKRLANKLSEIIIHFRQQPHFIFDQEQRKLSENKLVIKLQPDEGIKLEIVTKDQGLDKGMQLRKAPLELSFSEAFQMQRVPDAYERLIMEVMLGRQNLFVRRDEIEQAWIWCDQLMHLWRMQNSPPLQYAAGTWGPIHSDLMLANEGRVWHENQ